MAKDFRELERKALADPKRRANIDRQRALLLGVLRRSQKALARRLDPNARGPT